MAAQFATESGDNPLWNYALAVYDRPGVKACLLTLQNEHQADVLLLLADSWLRSRQQGWPQTAPSADYVQWRDSMIRPLRALRQSLPRGAEPLRQQLLAAELTAEQEGLRRLYLSLAAAPAGVLSTAPEDFYFTGPAQKKEARGPLFQHFISLTAD